jgi:hypothetical protein
MTSTIKVNTIQNTCGADIIKESSNTITVGASGDTVALASGASQTGFGRTGTVDWCTTAKTSPFTATSGDGFFVNTTSGAITVTLPSSPSAGDIVAFKDYANTWDDNPVTLGRNGSKINGICLCATLDTESTSITLIYVDGTKGWQDIHDSTSNVTGGAFLSATGGTVATVCTNFKVHTFTGDGTFCVASGGGPKGRVDFLVVAGGGGGGGSTGPASHLGGGGAGGYRESKCSTVSGCWSASPLAIAQSLTLSPGPYTVTVGGGGPGGTGTSAPGITGASGVNSVFSTITSAGGGGGGADSGSSASGVPGGSGGGGSGSGGTGGTGNTPPVTPAQGNSGGASQSPWGGPLYASGGGGGAGAAGAAGTPSAAGVGGDGVTSSINNTPTARGGGGGGQQYNNSSRSGGSGGGGASGATNPGTVNTGGGGGGGAGPAGSAPNARAGGNGGSGIVIVRYRFQ